jgi:hypothetical protein
MENAVPHSMQPAMTPVNMVFFIFFMFISLSCG